LAPVTDVGRKKIGQEEGAQSEIVTRGERKKKPRKGHRSHKIVKKRPAGDNKHAQG